MSERDYDQGVADGIRSCNPALRELSEQIADLGADLGAKLEAAEGWIREVDHVEDCAAFARTSSRECDCGRTAILKRKGDGMTSASDPETPAEHLRHAISDALRYLDIEAQARDDHRFAGAARAILRGQLGNTAPLARLTGPANAEAPG